MKLRDLMFDAAGVPIDLDSEVMFESNKYKWEIRHSWYDVNVFLGCCLVVYTIVKKEMR